ncbi:MAG: triose-phosphate isomerase [Chitinophagales bacterium]|nr:triose-phosphate isomerase [Chitinophagaceae bacterium]MCB9064697.1 triose-phosphate isomerase [Chitinophagales bacterium]
MRKMIVAGNWKMNKNLQEGIQLVKDILEVSADLKADKQVVICPPFIHLASASELVVAKDNLYTGAQNCHMEASGAYTGETSAEMVKSTGATHVIIGHSERREYFNESNEMLAAKTNAALSNGLNVIFCCGEPLEIRDAGTQNNYVEEQIKAGLFHLNLEQLNNIVIAYEPIWAIGTGRTASSEQAQDMHAHIRSLIKNHYGDDAAENITILYGGSCKPSNADELFSCPDVDGGLIGGASLNAADFHGIIAAMLAQ